MELQALHSWQHPASKNPQNNLHNPRRNNLHNPLSQHNLLSNSGNSLLENNSNNSLLESNSNNNSNLLESRRNKIARGLCPLL
ncbi:hypothetical protein [Pampinifervens florentissimum]|uniref:hypothetical protein n=1 Tax=Pampinifervens florentissimum TaxID=1632019 RepID=UPI0013B4889C|nr:hypothetical protein [Hydrogenobacter sp. T-8]QID33963.1 hypothetical protein G3M65_09325 [Hydrogenobacter sp. T-8]